MSEEPAPERNELAPETLRGLAAAAGVSLSDERVAALVAQAEPHFALLRQLDAAAPSSTEPATVFRLDRWSSAGSD